MPTPSRWPRTPIRAPAAGRRGPPGRPSRVASLHAAREGVVPGFLLLSQRRLLREDGFVLLQLMGADFLERCILLVVAPVQVFSCVINVHAGLMAFLLSSAVVNRLRCGDEVKCELFFRNCAPHLSVVVRLVLATGVPPLLEGYQAIFVTNCTRWPSSV